MFSRFARLIRSTPIKPLLACTLITTVYGLNKVRLQEAKPEITSNSIEGHGPSLDKMLKQIVSRQICDTKQIREGQLYFTQVKEQVPGLEENENKSVPIVIVRFQGKLYSVSGVCSYRDPLEDTGQGSNLTLQDAIVFNNKLYCPHHGCAFDVTSGSVQYGPALDNLARFFAEEKDGKVIIHHPAKMPRSVEPKLQLRDHNDQRKVVVVGGDHNATMGFINGLKQFDYGGELTVIHRDGEYSYPYHNQLLHRCIKNLQKGSKKWMFYSQKQIQEHLEQSLYSRLRFHDPQWYKIFGVDFVFNDQYFRLINKKYFPYLKFSTGSKMQFDGLMITEKCLPKITSPLNGITQKRLKSDDKNLVGNFTSDQEQSKLNLPQNVFAPFYNKNEHMRMLKFFNRNKMDTLLVMGMNIQSLQFCEAFHKQFPNTKIKVLDMNKENSMTEIYGPQIGDQIIKQYTKRGLQFYIKIQKIPQCSNKLALKGNQIESKIVQNNEKLYSSILKTKRQINAVENNESLKQKQKSKKIKALQQKLAKDEQLYVKQQIKIKDGIQINLGNDMIISGEAMVLFPNNYIGDVSSLKRSKFTDIDYNKNNNRVIVDPSSRTDTKRIFAAGTSTSLEFFFTLERIDLINPNMSYEQGMIAAFNMQALNIPFAYIPFQKHSFFGKSILYAGVRKYFNEVYVMGDLQNWDFLALYAVDNQVVAVSASPSKQKQFQVFRQSFRLKCAPNLRDVVSGVWNVPLLYKLIRKLNKSGCYKDEIRQLDPSMNIADVIWMQRDHGTFVQNQGVEGQSNVELDRRGYVSEV